MTGQHSRLITLADLETHHVGRVVTIGDTTAVLAGVIPVGGRVQLNLILGGQHCWTAAYPADAHVEVHAKSAVVS